MNRICEFCGKVIRGKYKKKFCSKICAFKAREVKKGNGRKRKETICWSCDNACGGCSWSKALVPVERWSAVKIRLKSEYNEKGYIDSYIVSSCPLYKHTPRRSNG